VLRERVRRFRVATAALLRSTALPPLPRDLGLPARYVLAAPATGQIVYRIVGRSKLANLDPMYFASNRERGRPRGPQQDYMDWLGISVFGTLDAALDNAVKYPKMIAPIRLRAGNGFMIARTEADIDHHYALWGDPEALLGHVLGDVVRVDDPG
jgi:hypothetical protein